MVTRVKEVVQDDVNALSWTAVYSAVPLRWAVRPRMNNRMSDSYENICVSLVLLTTFLRICVKVFKVRLMFLGLSF